jgi:[ribosomal protein S5]-alanine N-acetyltransferase
MSLLAIENFETPRLLIRPVQADDLPDLLLVNSDAAVVRFLPYAAWRSLADAQAWLKRMQAQESNGATRQFVLTERAGGRVIGSLLLFRHDAGSARLELGYVLGRASWGQGFMREALHDSCARLFADHGMRRLEAEVHTANGPSAALLRSLGFQFEGRLRQRWVAQGQPYDVDHFGLLAGELSAATRAG